MNQNKTEGFLIDKREFRKRRRNLIAKYNDILQKILDLPFENTLSWGDIVEENAEKFSDRIALRYKDETFTYKQFNEISNKFSDYFISIGISKGDVVQIALPNRPEFLFILTALSKIGAIAALINIDLKGNSLIYSIEKTLGKVLIIDLEIIDSLQNISSSISLDEIDYLLFIPDEERLKNQTPKEFSNLQILIQDHSVNNPSTTKNVRTMDPIAYVFTSGTTGLPKAAIRNHYGMCSAGYLYGAVMAKLTPDDNFLLDLPLFHTTAFSVAWPAAFATGATLVLHKKFHVSTFWEDVRKYDITAFAYVGEICTYLMNQPPTSQDVDNKVRAIIGNGMRTEIWREFKKRFQIEYIGEFYGASEVPAVFANLLNFDCTLGMCSSPFAIVKYDFEKNEPYRNQKGFMEKVEPGEIGLILFENKGTTQYCGYTDKKATEKKIFRDVFSKGDSWANNGDLLRNQGCNHAQFIDRLGDTFRWKGHNISTIEVEKILNSYPQVKISTVYGVKVPHVGGRAGMAALIPSYNLEKFDFNNFYLYLSKNLPHYAIPIFLRFKSEILTTSTYKLKKNQLKKQGFNPEKSNDVLYFFNPKQNNYFLLDNKAFQSIKNQEWKI